MLHKLESLETRKEGIFVMPKEVRHMSTVGPCQVEKHTQAFAR